jgi:actin-related protein 10
MISSILVVGGTASLPGFILRLRVSLLRLLFPPLSFDVMEHGFEPGSDLSVTIPSTASPLPSRATTRTDQARRRETQEWRRRHLEPFKLLYPLSSSLTIINDPAPYDTADTDTEAEPGTPSFISSRGGSVPRWKPSLMSWVGGSLIGALKSGGREIMREEWDESVRDWKERGEAWKGEMEEVEAWARSMGVEGEERGDEDEGDAGVVEATRGTGDEATAQAVDIERLRAGMARKGGGRRKKGWNADFGLIGDWTTSRVVVPN